MQELVMPKVSLGDDDETMVLLQWLVEPGQSFDEGDPLIEVETSKANMEVEAPFAGVLAATVREPGDEVVAGEVLAVVADPGETVDPIELAAATTVDAAATQAEPRPQVPPAADGEVRPETAVVPIALESGVERTRPDADEEADTKSGASRDPFDAPGEFFGLPPAGQPARRPTVDSRRSAPAPAADLHDTGARRPLSRHRQALSRLMTRSAEIPQFSVHRDLPMAAAQRAVAELRADNIPTTLTDVVLRATAEALLIHPEMNCHFRDGDVYGYATPRIALAADSPAGVVAPVITAPQGLSWSELARERRRVVEGARNGRLLPADLTGGTFAISNVGALGGDLVVPMLTPPQVAILGLGRVRPVVGMMVATGVLVADHRALDGADAARYLATLADLLEQASSREVVGGRR